MKVLIVHNAYQQRGGEDAVVATEARLLAERGHDVVFYRRHNDELQTRWQLWRKSLQESIPSGRRILITR